MKLDIQWHNDQFNVVLTSQEGQEPFLEVKGCRIANGSKGSFVSWPSTKNASTGKWWQHVWGSERFNEAVLSRALESQAASRKSAAGAQKPNRQSDPDDGSDIPF